MFKASQWAVRDKTSKKTKNAEYTTHTLLFLSIHNIYIYIVCIIHNVKKTCLTGRLHIWLIETGLYFLPRDKMRFMLYDLIKIVINTPRLKILLK